MRRLSMVALSLCLGLCTATIALAHSERTIREAFPQGPVPEDVAEATREFESTAGMSAVRATAHDKQHQLLEQYLKAGWQRTCADSQALLPTLDEAIRLARDTGDVEKESDLRGKRDDVGSIIEDACAESTPGAPSQP